MTETLSDIRIMQVVSRGGGGKRLEEWSDGRGVHARNKG